MIEKPAIEDAIIIACLQTEYELSVTKLSFLPIGADVNNVPKFLHDQGIAECVDSYPL